MAVSTAQIPALLLPGVRKIKGDYAEIQTQWSQVFAQYNSDLQVERTISAEYLPLAALKNQGGPTNFFNNSGQRFVYNHIHVQIAH